MPITTRTISNASGAAQGTIVTQAEYDALAALPAEDFETTLYFIVG